MTLPVGFAGIEQALAHIHERAMSVVRRALAPTWRARRAAGYLAAVAGVALASMLIGIIERFARFGNISLLYLLVVLWLAATFGRGPAIAASVLAFLAYNYLFIPPLFKLTVDDPTEWISLSALLAASLVAGQLTAAVRARAQEARENQQRTATLYALSQLIVSTTDQDDLLRKLAERVVAVFAPAGVLACALILPDARQQPVTRAVAPADSSLAAALADAAHAAPVARLLRGAPGVGVSAAGEVVYHGAERTVLVPLSSGPRVVGVLAIAGAPAVARLIGVPATPQTPFPATRVPEADLFAAFRDQIALALDHLELRQVAIHTEALRESDRLKTALLGSVTHDLRTPLAAIQAASGSLLDPGIAWSDADRRTIAETIETSADRLSRLVSNLLDLSRLEAGVALPEKRWYPIGDVIATVLDRLDMARRINGRHIVLTMPEDLPLVPLDHAQMEQVLTNLLENALKYSPPDTPITVRARVTGTPRQLEVRVSDRGIGIPAGELEAIFGRFYRVERTRLPWSPERPPLGTGLGLAICAGIVQAHGGRIWAESAPGAGATLIFTLPIPDAAPRPTPPAPEYPDAQGRPAMLSASGENTAP
jgi:two-component system sensor histidine kinase KdpD